MFSSSPAQTSIYTPDTGFTGVETITYTIRDNHGLPNTGTVTVWVDTASADPVGRPNALTDYFYVYQGTSVGFGAGQLLANDFEPAGQALTVVAVSEPSPVDGTLAGNPVDGYVFTPASTAALVGTDSAARVSI